MILPHWKAWKTQSHNLFLARLLIRLAFKVLHKWWLFCEEHSKYINAISLPWEDQNMLTQRLLRDQFLSNFKGHYKETLLFLVQVQLEDSLKKQSGHAMVA